MQDLNKLKYDQSFSSFKQSDFYSCLHNPYYILHKDYLGAYLKCTDQETIIDYKNVINIEINRELQYQKDDIIIYLPFQWKGTPLILWTL